jgi:hypothetical protein
MVNWHLSDNVRLEMAYGYGHLNRFDLKGNTHFFQPVFNCNLRCFAVRETVVRIALTLGNQRHGYRLIGTRSWNAVLPISPSTF